MKRRASLFAMGCLASAGLSASLRPSRRASELLVPVELASQVPIGFSEWRVDASIVPVLPDPATQANLDRFYTQTLARTYVDSRGSHVMLSIAYGADQGSDATQAHRPEICYAAQGFSIDLIGHVTVRFGSQDMQVKRLVGRRGNRLEHITYWMTLNDKAVLPGMTRQIAQLRLGLAGQIPDGMLVRTSSVEPQQSHPFEIQDKFLSQLHANLAHGVRPRYFGS